MTEQYNTHTCSRGQDRDQCRSDSAAHGSSLAAFRPSRSLAIVLSVFLIILAVIGAGAGVGVASADVSANTTAGPTPDVFLQVDDEPPDEAEADDEADDEDEDDAASDGGETDVDGEPVGIDDATEAAGVGGDDDEGADGEGDDGPPEGVTAGEYYDDEQLDEWQAEADGELSLDADIREMDAQSVHEIFVLDDEGAEEGETEQVGSDIGPSTDPAENAEALAEWLDEWLTSGFVWFVDEFVNNLLGTPYPDNDGWMGILGTPTDGQYQELYDFSMELVMLPVLSLIVVAFIFYTLFIVPAAPLLGRQVTPALLGLFGAVILVIFGWNFATLNQFAADAMTQWFLPSGEELLEIEEDGETADFSEDNHELRSGPTAALLGVKILGWQVAAVLLVFHSARHMILILLPALMPILLAGMFYGPRVSKATFSIAFWQYMALTYSNIPTALFLSMAFHIDFGFGFAGEYGELSNVAMTMFLFGLGIFFPALFHTAAFGGAIAAITMKGSVASAAGSYISGRMPARGTVSREATHAGDYINPVSWYKQRSSTATGRDAMRRSVGSRYGAGGSSRRMGSDRKMATDGGHPTVRNSRRPRSPPRRRRNPGPDDDQSDDSSPKTIDQRRRDLYRRTQREDGE